MRTIKLYCKECNAKLTSDLKEIDFSKIKWVDLEQILNPEEFTIAINPNNKEKSILISLQEHHLINHSDSKKFSGCCGSSGSYGMNKLCKNGHEVATEFSDCWTSYYIEFNLDKVKIKEKVDEFNYQPFQINW